MIKTTCEFTINGKFYTCHTNCTDHEIHRLTYSNNDGYSQEWYKSWNRHRLNGPAYMAFDEYKKLYMAQWYVEGKYLSQFHYYLVDTTNFVDTLFKYAETFPNNIKQIEILARHNNWLNEEHLLLLNSIDLVKS